MRACGKQYKSVTEAEHSKAVVQLGGVITPDCWYCGGVHVRVPKTAAVPPLRLTGSPGRCRAAEFSPAVKLKVRTRAGAGDAAMARCEHCGAFLGESSGEFQHIVARGMGGSRNPLLGTAANAVLLCPFSHRKAESRSREMRELGFWAPQGTDPRTIPMMLSSQYGSGRLVWRSPTGEYLLKPPELVS